jgi:hypothetical protein
MERKPLDRLLNETFAEQSSGYKTDIFAPRTASQRNTSNTTRNVERAALSGYTCPNHPPLCSGKFYLRNIGMIRETRQNQVLGLPCAVLYGIASLYFGLLGVCEYVANVRETIALTYIFSAAVIGCISFAYLTTQLPKLAYDGATLLRRAAVTIAALVTIGSVIFYRPRGWDPCAYLCGSLAVCGYPTVYPVHRAPLTCWINVPFVSLPACTNALLYLSLCLVFWRIARRSQAAFLYSAAIIALASNDLILSSLFTTNSELPAATVLMLAIWALYSGHPMLAGLTFGLAGLARWNLAVFPIALTIANGAQRQIATSLRLATGGIIVVVTFVTAYHLIFTHPIREIFQSNFVSAYAWHDDFDQVPTNASRFLFYGENFYFLTLPGFAALIFLLCPRSNVSESERSADGVDRAICWGIISYCTVMTFLGGHLARFMTPIVPVAILMIVRAADRIRPEPSSGEQSLVRWGHATILVSAIVIASGNWPGSFLFQIRDNLKWEPLDPQLCRAIQALKIRQEINAPNVRPFSNSGGHEASFQLRTALRIPGAERDLTGDLIPASDWRTAQEVLWSQLKPGDLAIVHRDTELPARTKLVVSGTEWKLCEVGP